MSRAPATRAPRGAASVRSFGARSFGAALVYAAALSLAARLEAQEQPLPELFKDKALSVSIQASVVEGPQSVAWESASLRYTVPGNPVGVKLVGSNVVILVQITPFEDGKGGLVLVSQGQVWVRRGEGDLSYRTTLDSVSVRYGEPVHFFPLGRDPGGKAPIRIEISVDRYRGAPPSGAPSPVSIPAPPAESAKPKK